MMQSRNKNNVCKEKKEKDNRAKTQNTTAPKTTKGGRGRKEREEPQNMPQEDFA